MTLADFLTVCGSSRLVIVNLHHRKMGSRMNECNTLVRTRPMMKALTVCREVSVRWFVVTTLFPFLTDGRGSLGLCPNLVTCFIRK